MRSLAYPSPVKLTWLRLAYSATSFAEHPQNADCWSVPLPEQPGKCVLLPSNSALPATTILSMIEDFSLLNGSWWDRCLDGFPWLSETLKDARGYPKNYRGEPDVLTSQPGVFSAWRR